MIVGQFKICWNENNLFLWISYGQEKKKGKEEVALAICLINHLLSKKKIEVEFKWKHWITYEIVSLFIEKLFNFIYFWIK